MSYEGVLNTFLAPLRPSANEPHYIRRRLSRAYCNKPRTWYPRRRQKFCNWNLFTTFRWFFPPAPIILWCAFCCCFYFFFLRNGAKREETGSTREPYYVNFKLKQILGWTEANSGKVGRTGWQAGMYNDVVSTHIWHAAFSMSSSLILPMHFWRVTVWEFVERCTLTLQLPVHFPGHM